MRCLSCHHDFGPIRALLAFVTLTTLAAPLFAAEPSSDDLAFFEQHVRPLFVETCRKCHGPKSRKPGCGSTPARRRSAAAKTARALTPGRPDESLLVLAVRHSGDVKMPPNGKLPARQIEALAEWVRRGAPWPAEQVASLTRSGPPTAEERRFWSFQPVRRPAVPAVRDAGWPITAIDRFILARLESEGLARRGPADKRTLLRRATFDLTGLPPTPEEIREFLADDSPGAFASVVDRLLASQAYGERWGRHWLDVARYADTAGDGSDYPVREAYKYRNWVIDAHNADEPFDQFIREQIAGDIYAREAAAAGAISPAEYARLVTATGYLAVTKRFGYNINTDFVHLDIADTIDVLGRSLLGLSLGCARCHDHKYDPVTADDYYGLYGIFASSQFTFPGGEEHKRPHNLVPLVPPAEAAARDKTRADQLAALDAKLNALTEERKIVAAQEAGEAQTLRLKEIDATTTILKQQREQLAAQELYSVAYAVVEGAQPTNARVHKRGEPDKLGTETPRGWLELFGDEGLPAEEKGSGRRQLARWLTSPDNPLFWRGYSSIASGSSTSAAGWWRRPAISARGAAPSHPELLDYLAGEFVHGGWSLKTLHRQVMLSAAYQQGSADDPEALAADPANRWLWKYPRRALDAESLRDGMLAVSDELNRSQGGPHPFPAVHTWNFSIHVPFYGVYDHRQRSVYLMVQRQKKHPYLSLFDGADPNLTTEQRGATTTATQALFLMNDEFVHARSQGLARRLLASAADEPPRIALAFELTTGKPPSESQQAGAAAFLANYREQLQMSGTSDVEVAAWAALARTLLVSNAFLFVD